MSGSIASPVADSHRVIPENRKRMASATLRKPETEDSLKELGDCLDYVRREMGWTIDELAGRLPPPPGKDKRDPGQVQRWIDGKERTQVDVVFQVEALRQPFVIALAKLAACDVVTTISVRRTA